MEKRMLRWPRCSSQLAATAKREVTIRVFASSHSWWMGSILFPISIRKNGQVDRAIEKKADDARISSLALAPPKPRTNLMIGGIPQKYRKAVLLTIPSNGAHNNARSRSGNRASRNNPDNAAQLTKAAPANAQALRTADVGSECRNTPCAKAATCATKSSPHTAVRIQQAVRLRWTIVVA